MVRKSHIRALPRTAYASTVGRMTDATRPFALPAEPTPDDALSAAIRSHLAYRRLTQGDLAEALGVSQTQVSARLRGEVRWSVADLVAVADWLDVHPSQLLGDAA